MSIPIRTRIPTPIAPRPATLAECTELAGSACEWEYGYNYGDEEFVDTRDALRAGGVAIFEHFTSDGPGYSGPLAVVVWSGGPEIISSFVKRNDRWEMEASTA